MRTVCEMYSHHLHQMFCAYGFPKKKHLFLPTTQNKNHSVYCKILDGLENIERETEEVSGECI